MKRIAITGGIGSGKSYVCRLLNQRGIDIYDCDDAAKRLMHSSTRLREQLTQLIGPDTYINNVLNKAAVAQFLLASDDNAHAIDSIVHPAVAEDFRNSGLTWMECAILYESGFDQLVDLVIVVTAPEEVRLQRIINRDDITPQKAREWISRQWPQQELQRRADYEIRNDGLLPLEPQIDNIIQQITTCNRQF
ncbi:MAG: dephospho-CoA kinase [Prevotella sp.]|nr:dephospho-CoA kinase [Prevotella sp.]